MGGMYNSSYFYLIYKVFESILLVFLESLLTNILVGVVRYFVDVSRCKKEYPTS